MEIHTADSMAASRGPTSWASRWRTRRSTSSSATMTPSSTAQCHGSTSRSTKFEPLAAASSERHFVSLAAADDRLGGGQAGDRHPERRAAHVVEAGVVEEGDRLGVAAVLAAHAELELGLGLPAEPGADAHELADAVGVDRLERVALQQPLLEVGRHHPALDVVAAEPERHLRQVVGAEAEEVGLLGDLVGADRGARRLDHRADRDVGLLLQRSWWPPSISSCDPAAGQGQLLAGDRERDHDLDDRVLALRRAASAAASSSARTCIA